MKLQINTSSSAIVLQISNNWSQLQKKSIYRQDDIIFHGLKCLDYKKSNPPNSFQTNGQQWLSDLHHLIKYFKSNKRCLPLNSYENFKSFHVIFLTFSIFFWISNKIKCNLKRKLVYPSKREILHLLCLCDVDQWF